MNFKNLRKIDDSHQKNDYDFLTHKSSNIIYSQPLKRKIRN